MLAYSASTILGFRSLANCFRAKTAISYSSTAGGLDACTHKANKCFPLF